MALGIDLGSSCAVVLIAATLTCRVLAIAGVTAGRGREGDEGRPGWWTAIAAAFVTALSPLVDVLVKARVSANTITTASLAVGLFGGLALGFGLFGLAAFAILSASLADALDGAVARRSGTASASGAIFDASVDRYQEFAAFVGLAILLRTSAVVLGLVLLALVGSFMVSYGSAKAEAIGASVPAGAMRRPERAVCLCIGTALTPPFAWLANRGVLPEWTAHLPILIALAVLAVVANASAIHRLRLIARGRSASRPRLPARHGESPTPAGAITPHAAS